MANIHHSGASLRIFGDKLDPDEISRLLGGTPTESFRKGEIKPSKITNIVRKSGGWLLKAKPKEPENLNAQVEEILEKLSQDLNVWAGLSNEYKVDLFCGLFMHETDEGLEISAKNMKALGERGIKLGLCIYAPSQDIAPNDPCPCSSGKTYVECCAPKSADKT
jgi:hypothetical protein